MSNNKGCFLKNLKLIFSILIFIIITCIIISPAKFISASMNGISAWTFNVLPSVLPFMILTRIIIDLGSFENALSIINSPFKKIYKTKSNSGYIFLMSILSGYPVGSKMIADLYENGTISQEEAFKMSSFCSNSGPMFIVGSVGVGMLFNPLAGYIILASHIFSALINGLLYRNLRTSNENYLKELKTERNKVEFSFSDIILSAVQSILSVGAIICLFFIIIECLNPVFSLFPQPISSFFEGLIEITKGCLDLSNYKNLLICLPLCSFIITFGGLSTIFQSITILKKVKMPIWLFTLEKLTQAIISTFITFILCLIIF